MVRWKYLAVNVKTGDRYEGTVPMPDVEENAHAVVERIDELRGKLMERGYRFVRAMPLTDAEIRSEAVKEGAKKFKGNRLKADDSQPAWPIFLGLSCLLAFLLVLWRLCI